jgi:DNA-binding NtrC family response regulator
MESSSNETVSTGRRVLIIGDKFEEEVELAFEDKRKLLIADDDSEMRAWLGVALDAVKCEIREASSGWDLLDTLAEDGPFDLIVTDVRMPGPSGLQVVEMARTAGLQTPFLVITAFPDDRLRAEAAAMSRVSMLEKPFSNADLVEAVHRLLHQRSSADA